MDEANKIIHGILDEVERLIEPGISSAEIDALAEKRCREAGAVPAFLGYPHWANGPDFPGTVCASVNSAIVHGVPSPAKLAEGDIISVDMGVLHRGYYGDSARTFPVGRVSEETARLLRVTRESLDRAIEVVRPGNRVSDIGHAVQTHVEAAGFSIVREFVGHGIGTELHEDPQVPNFGKPGQRERLEPGMVLAIEPMVNIGKPDVVVSDADGWTARTKDDSLSAHFEVCVAVTEDGNRVLGNYRTLAAA